MIISTKILIKKTIYKSVENFVREIVMKENKKIVKNTYNTLKS
jgi:hypothetical protein